MRLAVSAIVLIPTFVLLYKPIQRALIRNDLSLCLEEATLSVARGKCAAKLQKLRTYSTANPELVTVMGRFAGVLGDSPQVIELLDGTDAQQLDLLAAYHLVVAYNEAARTSSAVFLADQAGLPTKMLVAWAMDAQQSGHLDAARMWLYAASAHPPADWETRRSMGFLWWELDRDVHKALSYLELVHAEMPEAVYPMRLLGQIYRTTSIDRSVEILDRALTLAPDDLFVMRELILSLSSRGTASDLERTSVLVKRILPLLEAYLQEHPEAEALSRWRDALLEEQWISPSD